MSDTLDGKKIKDVQLRYKEPTGFSLGEWKGKGTFETPQDQTGVDLDGTVKYEGPEYRGDVLITEWELDEHGKITKVAFVGNGPLMRQNA